MVENNKLISTSLDLCVGNSALSRKQTEIVAQMAKPIKHICALSETAVFLHGMGGNGFIHDTEVNATMELNVRMPDRVIRCCYDRKAKKLYCLNKEGKLFVFGD